MAVNNNEVFYLFPLTTSDNSLQASRKSTFKKEYFWSCVKNENGVALCNIIPATMQLMMYIGNDLIESIPLETDRIQRPGYVGQFKRNLKIKYRELIRQYKNPPEFLVINPIPQANPAENNHRGK